MTSYNYSEIVRRYAALLFLMKGAIMLRELLLPELQLLLRELLRLQVLPRRPLLRDLLDNACEVGDGRLDASKELGEELFS